MTPDTRTTENRYEPHECNTTWDWQQRIRDAGAHRRDDRMTPKAEGHDHKVNAGCFPSCSAHYSRGAAPLDLLRDLVQHWDAGDIDHDYDSISGAFDAARDMVRSTISLSGEHRHPEGAAPRAEGHARRAAFLAITDAIANRRSIPASEVSRWLDAVEAGAAPRAEGLDVTDRDAVLDRLHNDPAARYFYELGKTAPKEHEHEWHYGRCRYEGCLAMAPQERRDNE